MNNVTILRAPGGSTIGLFLS